LPRADPDPPIKAILLRRPGGPSALEYVDVPTPQPGKGEVLVKADTIGVSMPEVLVPVAEPGELWVLGRHRLLCGDSTVATDVERVLGGVAPHLMVTDPPYRVNYDPAWRNQAGRSINGTTQRIATGTVIKPIGASDANPWARPVSSAWA
jgi:hypothetical protein